MSSVLRSDPLARDAFVGREREMDILRATLEETLARQGRAVVLLGEPGLAKRAWPPSSLRMRKGGACAS
jgi:hypothetical protein